MIIVENLEIHDTLNPKIWTNDNLDEDVKSKVLKIVDEFKDFIEIPFRIVDIQIVGSNASYNYTDQSDLDVHIITRFEELGEPNELVNLALNSSKSSFNDKYDISIHGINVELYIEDINTTARSNGIYSVMYNKWIKYPDPIDIDYPDISSYVNKWSGAINMILSSDNINKVEAILDKIYLIRKNSIAIDGEYSKGNLLFKELRNQGLINKLKERLDELKSKELSLENMEVSYD